MNAADSTWPLITAPMEPILRPETAPKKSASPQPRAAASPKITPVAASGVAAEPGVAPCDGRLESLLRRDTTELVPGRQVRRLDHHVELGVRGHGGPEPRHVPGTIDRTLRGLDHERLVLRDLLRELQRGGVELLTGDDP